MKGDSYRTPIGSEYYQSVERASLIRGAGIYWIFYRDLVVYCEEHGGRRIVKRKQATGKL